MAAYQQGDDKAFAILYERHSAKVYGFVQSRLRERALVDDIFQSIFMKLHRTRSHYDPSFPFVPWLFTISRSVLIDGVRKKNRSLEDLNEVAVENAQANFPQDQAQTLPTLSELPLMQKKAIEMRYGEEELSFEQIAHRLETSPQNARQLISRAIKKLKLLAAGQGRSK